MKELEPNFNDRSLEELFAVDKLLDLFEYQGQDIDILRINVWKNINRLLECADEIYPDDGRENNSNEEYDYKGDWGKHNG